MIIKTNKIKKIRRNKIKKLGGTAEKLNLKITDKKDLNDLLTFFKFICKRIYKF